MLFTPGLTFVLRYLRIIKSWAAFAIPNRPSIYVLIKVLKLILTSVTFGFAFG